MGIRKNILAAFVILTTGCSMAQPTNQTLQINCNVPDTVLRVNGDQYACPSVVSVRRDKEIPIEAYKDGYDRYSKLVKCHLSPSAKMDIVGTCLWFFPIIGLAYPGAWDLDETEINVVLNKLN